MLIEPIRSPKLKGSSGLGRSHWYPYYAGYSPDFVVDVLRRLNIRDGGDQIVADPWNGSGTTTTICSMKNIVSAGFDINPAMIVVAKARLIGTNNADSLSPILRAVMESAVDMAVTPRVDEPLAAWFTRGTAARIRSIELALRRLLVSPNAATPGGIADTNQISSLAAFYYVLLFRLVRRTARAQAGSNPTWTRRAVDEEQLVRLTQKELTKELIDDLKQIQLLDASLLQFRTAQADIRRADSRNLPLPNGFAEAVISSPPYCTRIDYAVATRMELAVLGLGAKDDISQLRRTMLGTTLTPQAMPKPQKLSPYIDSLLERISNHKSKASATYYLSTYRDYFEKFSQSIREVGRIVTQTGRAALVVQDSAYKEIHVDLAKATCELMQGEGFEQSDRVDFECDRSMRDLGELRRRAEKPVESVLLFRRN